MIRLPEVDADAWKHIAVLTINKILFIYVYVCVFVVYLLVWIMNCTRCMVYVSKYEFNIL